MRYILVLFLAATLAGISNADDSPLDRYQGCWKTSTAINNMSKTVALCFDGKSVKVEVFYPNRGDNSTTCHSQGRLESSDSSDLIIRTTQGACENNNSFAATVLTCMLLNDNELSCLTPEYVQIHVIRQSASDQSS